MTDQDGTLGFPVKSSDLWWAFLAICFLWRMMGSEKVWVSIAQGLAAAGMFLNWLLHCFKQQGKITQVLLWLSAGLLALGTALQIFLPEPDLLAE